MALAPSHSGVKKNLSGSAGAKSLLKHGGLFNAKLAKVREGRKEDATWHKLVIANNH
ncbi:MAG: hypothetical protein JNL09_09610 [Anaerolineales bacterium]|nr:hypothetical protein [Anaerolineales bacterium]